MLVLDVIKLDMCVLGTFHQEINAGRVIRRRSHLGELEILFLNERICNSTFKGKLCSCLTCQ